MKIRLHSLIYMISVVSALITFTSPLSFSQHAGDPGKLYHDIKYTEELYVQTDRDIYIAGESVFLKIFKLNGITRTPGNVSQVVYVDLLDNLNNPVKQLKFGIDESSGSGEFRLPDTLRTGNYLIRSYTQWMRNFSSDLFSYKRIAVVNPFGNISNIKIPVPGHQPDSVVFYPESGRIVEGVDNIVGIRCFNRDGNPVGGKGVVIDSNNDTLCRVQIDSRGSGFLLVKPKRNGAITFVTGENKNNANRFALPPVQDTGISISIKSSREQGLFKIRIRRNRNISGNDRMYLVYYPVSISPFRREIPPGIDTEILVSKDTLPAGLAKIVIVDGNGVPMAKRWVYNEKTPNINYSLKLQKTAYSTREKIEIGITATDPDGNPVKSDLVVSVVKSFSVDNPDYDNLPGYMQLPAFAAMNTDSEYSDIGDYLIFYSNEDDILKTNSTRPGVVSFHLPELAGHLVSGVIMNITTGEPLKNERIALSFVGKTALCKFYKTDENGCFNFVISECGTREIVIQPLSNAIKDYYVQLNNPFSETFSSYKPVPFYPDSTRLTELNNSVISMQVKNIYEPFLKTNTLNLKKIDEHDFYGEPVDTVLISRYIELSSLKEVVKEIVPGVSIIKRNGKSKFDIVNENVNQPFKADPLLLVDGVPINDIDKILTLNPRDLERIEILKKRYLISDFVMEGVVHFITKKGNLSALEFDRTGFRQEFEALQTVNKFHSPDYSIDSLKYNRIPDFRNTLYWNPELKTDETGKTTVTFYTSDESGEYKILIKGISADGKTGSTELLFLVKDNLGSH